MYVKILVPPLFLRAKQAYLLYLPQYPFLCSTVSSILYVAEKVHVLFSFYAKILDTIEQRNGYLERYSTVFLKSAILDAGIVHDVICCQFLLVASFPLA